MFIVLSSLFCATNIFAQAASVTWALNNTTQLTSVNIGNVTGSVESISAGSGQFGMNVFDYNADGQRLWEGTAGWIAGSEESNRYIQFNALPASGNSFTVTGVSFNYRDFANSINTNYLNSNVYYSIDNWANRVALSSNPLLYLNSASSSFNGTLNVTVTSGSTFSVRIYPYAVHNSSAGSPTFAIHNNVVISGTISTKKMAVLQVTDVKDKWNKSVLLTAKLQEQGMVGNTNLPNQTIQFYVDNKFVNSGTTNTSGVASLMYTIPSDSAAQSISVQQDSVAHTLTASFAGDANYNPQSSLGKLTALSHTTMVTFTATISPTPVNQLPTRIIKFEATLTDNDNNKNGIPNKALKFNIAEGNGLQSKVVFTGSATTNTNGVASVMYTVPQDSVTRSISVSYTGDANYSAQSSTAKLKKFTAIQITDAAGKWNKSVLLTAKLQESGLAGNTNLPNQTIQFYVDNKFVNSGTTNASGVASLMYTIPQDSAAQSISVQQDSVAHTLSASYGGDVNYNSQSGTGKLTVVRHVTSIAVTPSIAVFGQPVVFTATLSDNDNNKKGISNEALMFKISENQSPIPLDRATTNANGIASLTFTIPQDSVASSHTIYAVYSGDANYSPQSGTGLLTFTLTVVDNALNIPAKFDLLQNYPNPFNPTSTIRYDIPKTTLVNISVFDMLGRKINTLVNEQKNPGHYEIVFDAREFASGIYIYRIKTDSFTQSKKMILMK